MRRRERVYGISPSWVEETLARQSGKCAICERAITTSANVDHDHLTGKVRGMLCSPCNKNLAMLENAAWLSAATRYLDRHSVRAA